MARQIAPTAVCGGAWPASSISTQAEACGKALADTAVVFDALFRSPMLRTEQTLAILQEKLQSSRSTIVDPRLHEKDHGRYELYAALSGDALAQLKADYKATKEFEVHENSGPEKSFAEKFLTSGDPQEIESLASVYRRVHEFVSHQKRARWVQNYLVVSHYGNMMALFARYASLAGFDVDYRAHIAENCAVLVLEVDEAGQHLVAAHGFIYKGLF